MNAHFDVQCSVFDVRCWRIGFRVSGFGFRVCAFVWICLLFTGCAPEETPSSRALDSQLFAGAQVIGERGGGAGQFNKPRSVAVDGDDNIFVIDMTGRVQKFSPEGQFLLSWQTPATDKGKAKGMGTDRDGNVLLVEPHYTRVNHFAPNGKLLHQWGVNGTNAGQLIFPRAVAVAPDGAIWISEYAFAERLQKFTADGSKVILTVGQPGAGPGEFHRAEGIGLDTAGKVFVADSCNHRIQVFSADGVFLRQYGRPGNQPGEMSYPYDIRVDTAGRQYVCEFGNSRIQVFDANDRLIEVIGGAGREPGQFNNPWSIALDSQGNLIVADSVNHRVQKFWRRRESAEVREPRAEDRIKSDSRNASLDEVRRESPKLRISASDRGVGKMKMTAPGIPSATADYRSTTPVPNGGRAGRRSCVWPFMPVSDVRLLHSAIGFRSWFGHRNSTFGLGFTIS